MRGEIHSLTFFRSKSFTSHGLFNWFILLIVTSPKISKYSNEKRSIHIHVFNQNHLRLMVGWIDLFCSLLQVQKYQNIQVNIGFGSPNLQWLPFIKRKDIMVSSPPLWPILTTFIIWFKWTLFLVNTMLNRSKQANSKLWEPSLNVTRTLPLSIR